MAGIIRVTAAPRGRSIPGYALADAGSIPGAKRPGGFISGATLTSQAFVQSLQYALNQAKE